ncbi:neuropeptide Y receptor-like protein [Leptotrombidium deliense]|uniref:Neuropeptide Y receptor-like protein n=1 Tax=Leptotrombidium deliense TaxID=299467 RepID=A0A443S4Z1_9ACAR|nr:neuropeptide Y receptor-like protein [Leptotrombidium deliense]
MEAREKQRKRVVLMLIIVVIVFAVCWLPLHALNFTDYVIKQLETQSNKKKGGQLCNDSTLYFSLYWLGISSCCYNPFIYWWMNADFRRGFKKLLPHFIVKYMKREESTFIGGTDQMQMIAVVDHQSSSDATSNTTKTTKSGSKTSADNEFKM